MGSIFYVVRQSRLLLIITGLCLSVLYATLSSSSTLANINQINSSSVECEKYGGTFTPGPPSRCNLGTVPFSSNHIAKTIRDNVTKHQHYWFLYSCFAINDINKTTKSDIDNWGFFNGSADNKAALGVMYPGSEGSSGGRRDCDNTQLIKTAFNLLGFTDSRDVFCKLKGATYNGKSVSYDNCIVPNPIDKDWDNNASRSEVANSFKSLAEKNKPSFDAEEEYVRAFLSLTSPRGCGLTEMPSKRALRTPLDAQTYSDNTHFDVPFIRVGTDGTYYKFIKAGIITTSPAKADLVYVGTSSTSGGPSSAQLKSCNQIATIANQNADAYITWLNEHKEQAAEQASQVDQNNEPTEDNDETSCAVDGIGWIVCPVVTFLGNLTDQVYNILANDLLQVSPSMFDRSTEGGETLFNAWSSVQNIANVLFVIAFLMIIYSQITGAGISNYGIKRMMPRLIIAAILVNASYWVCALAVDLSNVLGFSVKSFLDAGSGGLSFHKDSPFAGASTWSSFIVLGLAAVASVYLFLSVVLPGLIVVLFALVTVVAVLALRQALIILLIVVAPLAFVAWLLPNTEDWFKKWLSLFRTLLLMFPIIALIFGASSLAATIVMGSSESMIVQLVGALITVVPLFLTPIIMKTAGGLLNRFGGIVNNTDKGAFDRMKKGAAGLSERQKERRGGARIARGKSLIEGEGGPLGKKYSRGRRAAAYISSLGATGKINRDQEQAIHKAVAEENTQQYFAERALNDDGFAQRIAGGSERGETSVMASAQSAVDKIERQDIENRKILLRTKFAAGDLGGIGEALKKAIGDKDIVGARAAQDMLINAGNKGASTLRESLMNSGIDPSSTVGQGLKKDIASSNMKGRAADVYAWGTDKNNGTLTAHSESSGTWSGLSEAQLQGQVAGALEAAISSSGLTPEKAASTLRARGSEAIGEKEAEILRIHASRG